MKTKQRLIDWLAGRWKDHNSNSILLKEEEEEGIHKVMTRNITRWTKEMIKLLMRLLCFKIYPRIEITIDVEIAFITKKHTKTKIFNRIINRNLWKWHFSSSHGHSEHCAIKSISGTSLVFFPSSIHPPVKHSKRHFFKWKQKLKIIIMTWISWKSIKSYAFHVIEKNFLKEKWDNYLIELKKFVQPEKAF